MEVHDALRASFGGINRGKQGKLFLEKSAGSIAPGKTPADAPAKQRRFETAGVAQPRSGRSAPRRGRSRGKSSKMPSLSSKKFFRELITRDGKSPHLQPAFKELKESRSSHSTAKIPLLSRPRGIRFFNHPTGGIIWTPIKEKAHEKKRASSVNMPRLPSLPSCWRSSFEPLSCRPSKSPQGPWSRQIGRAHV